MNAKAALTPDAHRSLAAEIKALQSASEEFRRRLSRAENFISESGDFERYQAYIMTHAI